MNSLHKGPVTRKMFPFDDVIMVCDILCHHELPWVTSNEAANCSYMPVRKLSFFIYNIHFTYKVLENTDVIHHQIITIKLQNKRGKWLYFDEEKFTIDSFHQTDWANWKGINHYSDISQIIWMCKALIRSSDYAVSTSTTRFAIDVEYIMTKNE